MTGTALAAKATAPTTGTAPESRNETAKALIREMAMDIGKEVAAYIEVMYPDAVTAASSTFLLSVRNCIHNEIMAAIEVSDEGKIVARLAERKIFRRKWKVAYKNIRENDGKGYTVEEAEQAIQALIAENNQPEQK